VKLLLDTHVVLWWLGDPDVLAPEARDAIADGANLVYLSAAEPQPTRCEVSHSAALPRVVRLKP
jgi:hypothetical protein